MKSKRGRMLYPSRVYEILRNPIYVGEVHWGGLVNKKAKHKPLITRRVFQQTKAVMDGYNNHACRRRKHQFLLRGFVYCATCGRRLTGEWHFKKSGLKFAYYHCPKRNGCNRPNYMKKDELEEQVENKFKEIQFTDDFIDWAMPLIGRNLPKFTEFKEMLAPKLCGERRRK